MRHSESPQLRLPTELPPFIKLGRLFQITAIFLAIGALWGCSGGYCSGGNCNCNQNNECIVSCEDDGCDLACSGKGSSCGAICGDECKFECNGTPHCSSYSHDNSVIECHNVTSCAAECGANCDYDAHNVTEVHVKVGPGSSVTCRELSTCDVECVGECEVSCSNVSVGGCNLDCLDGTTKETDQGGGRLTCD